MNQAPARDPFIPGVYQFCNRWCERCLLTRSCALFAATETARLGPADYALAPDALFDELLSTTSDYLGQLEVLARRFGQRGFAQRRPGRSLVPPAASPITDRAKVFVRRVRQFSDLGFGLLSFRLNRFRAAFESIGQVSIDYQPFSAGIDCLAVLSWYRIFVPGRIKKAMELLWLYRREQSQSRKEQLLHQAIGHAAIAERGLTEVGQAIERFGQLFEEAEEEIERPLAEVQSLQKTILILFPQVHRLRSQSHWWVSWQQMISTPVALTPPPGGGK